MPAFGATQLDKLERILEKALAEAEAILASKKVSAAVIDYVLSDGNADDLCEDLKARGIPFALYSGYRGVDGNCARGEVLPKPACSDELVSMVLKMFSEKGVHVPSDCVMR